MAEQTLLDVDVINKSLASVTYDPDLIDFIIALQGANTTMSSIHSSMTAYRDAYLALYQSIPKYSGDNVSGEEDITIVERVNLEREPLAATLNGLRSYIAILLKLYRATGTYQVTGTRTILVDQIESIQLHRLDGLDTPLELKARTPNIDMRDMNLAFKFSSNAPGEHVIAKAGYEPMATPPYTSIQPKFTIDVSKLEANKLNLSYAWDDTSGKLTIKKTATGGELTAVCSILGETNVTGGGMEYAKVQIIPKSTGPTQESLPIASVSINSGDGDGTSRNIRTELQTSSRNAVPIQVSITSDVSKYGLFQELLRPVARCVAAYIKFVQDAVGSSAYSEDDISVLEG